MPYPEARDEPDNDWCNVTARLIANELVLCRLVHPDQVNEAFGAISRELCYLLKQGYRPVASD
jgi:hypothetical protein